MASTTPEQYRAVDPFASYNSNTVNQLTEMRSRAENVLDIPCGLDVVLDSTSPLTTVVVQPGYSFKDDVMIRITEEHTVDFGDVDQYISGTDWGEVGNYYVVLEYAYIKSRPAPQAKIKIVKPSQTGSYDYGNSVSSLMFLKSVAVIWTGSEFNISSLSDVDGSTERRYTKNYAGSVTALPTHNECRDKSRFAYDVTTDEFWFGYEDRWEPLNIAGTFNIDTDTLAVGDLAYVGTAGQAAAAIVTSVDTAAEMVVVEVGLAADGTGQARLSGYVQNVNVENLITISVGDLLYLSDTEPGHVTNAAASPLSQVVGRALTGGDWTVPIDILFFARAVLETNTASRLVQLITAPGDWTFDSTSSEYYYDVDISGLNLSSFTKDVVVSCRDTSLGANEDRIITPGDIDLSIADNVRVWMPVNTVSLAITIVG